jgi:oligopeptide transport system substrate-binding protein
MRLGQSGEKGEAMSRARLRILAVAGLGGIIAIACGGNTTGGGETLAADQTLTFPIIDDIATLDPGHVQSGVDITFTQEIFGGLYKFDNNLKEVPDIATGQPDVSSDGKSYTFHLRKDAKFSNGDLIKASDFLYSWNRAARLNDAYATIFDPVVGGTDVEAGKAQTMSGLSAPDDYTIKAQLTDPAGYWVTELGLWTADVIDQKVVQSAGEDLWWTKADTAIGSGPFKLTARTPKVSMVFAPVSSWWGGATGALKQVKVEVVQDQASQVKKFESGGYDVVGPGNSPPGPDDILRYKSDATKSKLLNVYPAASSTWMGFNFQKGPFKGVQEGHDGRQAFSRAIDRDQMVDIACVKGATCSKATGGYIAKGLKGYLGDGQDPNAKFDAAAAKAEYQKWDPDGSKVKGLQLRYNTSSTNTSLWSNIQSQLKSNLGVSVELAPSDFPTLIRDRNAKNAIIFRNRWGADYDHPQDWFNNLWSCAQAPPGKGGGEGYCNPAMDKIVADANTQPIDKVVGRYQDAQKLMIQDVVGAALRYDTQPYVTQTYLRGAGYNGLYDYGWTGMRILKH